MRSSRRLLTLSTKVFASSCNPNTLTYCPVLDLVAVATENATVEVFRLNGERVFGINAGLSEVNGVSWRGDGRVLAVASDDGVLKLVDVWSGKVVHRLIISKTGEEKEGKKGRRVEFLAWGKNSTAAESSLGKDASVEPFGIAGVGKSGSRIGIMPDLPRELAMLDVESSLPKMSTLPATGGDDDIFSTRASIDAILHRQNHTQPQNGQSRIDQDAIDVLLVGFDDGTIHIRIFGSFEIGDINISSALPKNLQQKRMKTLAHTSHASSPISLLVVQVEGEQSLKILSLDLGVLHSTATTSDASKSSNSGSTNFLPILVMKATQLQNILRYLIQIQGQLAREIQVAFDLPGRWLGNICEALAEADPPSSQESQSDDDKIAKGKLLFEAQITHLIATGECEEKVREWMVDELGERGVKRWEKAVGEGLEVVRRGMEECVLPALERCIVVLSRLRGLAGAPGVGEGFGLDEQVLAQITGIVDCMVLVANDALRCCGEEVRGFRRWIGWLRWEVEVQGCETEERREEVREGGVEGVEWLSVLAHLRGGLKGGNLPPLLGAEGLKERQWDEKRFYEEFKKARRKGGDVPGLGELVAKMRAECEGVFERIAESLRKNVLVQFESDWNPGHNVAHVDARMVRSMQTGQLETLLLGYRSDIESPRVDYLLLRLGRPDERGSRWRHMRSWQQTVADDAEQVLDVRIVDDGRALVLAKDASGTVLYGSDMFSKATWPVEGWEMLHNFDGQIRPVRMAVSGRKGRSVVCVLEEGGRRYEVLDLEGGEVDDGEAGESDEDEEMTE